MAALDKHQLHGNLLAFFKKHIQKTIATCSKESEYSWNSWREQVDPVIEVSEALGIDTEELKRAKEAYVNAQMHLLHVKQEHILKLKAGTLLMNPFYKEDLT